MTYATTKKQVMRSEMAHKHLCLACDKVIDEGDFDCELDADHDYELCSECAKEKTCEFCPHPAHSGCGQCDEGIPQTPNGWGSGHAVHYLAEGQGQCEFCGCTSHPQNDPYEPWQG